MLLNSAFTELPPLLVILFFYGQIRQSMFFYLFFILVRTIGAWFVQQTERNQPLIYPHISELLLCNKDEIELVLSPYHLIYNPTTHVIADLDSLETEPVKRSKHFIKTKLPFREPYCRIQEKIG